MPSRAKNAVAKNPKEDPDASSVAIFQGSSWREYAYKLRRALFASESSLLLVLVMLGLVIVFWVQLRDTAFMSTSNFMNIVKAKTPVAALAVGLVVGLTNGAITVLVGIPSFIVTLGMIGVLQGAARLISGEEAIPIVNNTYTSAFGTGSLGPIPILLIWTVGIGVLGAVVLRSTPFGKAVLATGGNPVAARYSGIRTRRIKVAVLVLSALSGALAGLLYSGQLASGRYDLGAGDLLTTLAAVIIGGTALSGGRGNVAGAIAGALLVGLVNNGVILLGFSTAQQQIFTGVIIVIAVDLSAHRRGQLGSLR